MPGEKELLREFVEKQFPAAEQPVFAHLLGVVFDKMKLAGEAGSLLKIEEEIRSAIADAKKLWKEGPKLEQTRLFHDLEAAKQKELKIDTSGITDEQFWEQAEQRIYDALEAYAEQAENGGGFQRRLFADDAAQGFAFIDLCRKRYDVVVMNPPFGEPTEGVARKIAKGYPKHGGNMAIMFHDRVAGLFASGGKVGAVVDNTILVKSTYAGFRDRFAVTKCLIREVCYLGWETLDGANVEVSLISAGQQHGTGFHMIEASAADRAETLLRATVGISRGNCGDSVLLFDAEKLALIPNYCISFAKETHLHASGEKLGKAYARAKQGLMAVDTPRFARLRWEIPCPDTISKWRAINFGGGYSPFYRDHSFVFNWWQNGAELKAKVLHNYPYLDGNWGWVVKNDGLYGKPGLAYGKRTDLLSVQIQNEDMLFGNEGFVVFTHRTEDTWFVLGFLNAPAVGNLLNSFCGQHKVSGYVDSIPVPALPSGKQRELAQIGRDGFESMRQASKTDESSALFSIFEPSAISLSAGFALVKSAVRQLQEYVTNLQNRADDIVEESLGDIEKRVLKKIELEAVETDYIAGQLSLWLGYAFGRWDIRYATGERPAPELPDPFAPLPVCPPGNAPRRRRPAAFARSRPPAAGRGPLPARRGLGRHPRGRPGSSAGHRSRVREALAVIWGDRADAIEQEACADARRPNHCAISSAGPRASSPIT